MNKLTVIFSVIAISVLAACSTKKLATTTPATPTPPATASTTLTTEQIEKGKSLWSGNCGKCHTLYAPDSRNVASWQRILPSMTRKAKMNDDDAATVTAYILAHSKG
jgi:cytochrome c5